MKNILNMFLKLCLKMTRNKEKIGALNTNAIRISADLTVVELRQPKDGCGGISEADNATKNTLSELARSR